MLSTPSISKIVIISTESKMLPTAPDHIQRPPGYRQILLLHEAIHKEDFIGVIETFCPTMNLADTINGSTLLSIAIHNSSARIIKLLLILNAPINQKSWIPTGNQETPLISAIRLDREDVINDLLSFGADPDLPGYGNKSPIWFAAKDYKLNYVRYLLGHGATITFDSYNKNPINLLSHFLGYSIQEVQFQVGYVLFPEITNKPIENQRLILIELIIAGLEPLQKDNRSFTPTFWTSRSADIGLTTLLIEAGAKFNHGPRVHALFIPLEWKSSEKCLTWIDNELKNPPPLTRTASNRIRELIRLNTRKDIRLSLHKLNLPKLLIDILSLKQPANFAASTTLPYPTQSFPTLTTGNIQYFHSEQLATQPYQLPDTQHLDIRYEQPPPLFNVQ